MDPEEVKTRQEQLWINSSVSSAEMNSTKLGGTKPLPHKGPDRPLRSHGAELMMLFTGKMWAQIASQVDPSKYLRSKDHQAHPISLRKQKKKMCVPFSLSLVPNKSATAISTTKHIPCKHGKTLSTALTIQSSSSGQASHPMTKQDSPQERRWAELVQRATGMTDPWPPALVHLWWTEQSRAARILWLCNVYYDCLTYGGLTGSHFLPLTKVGRSMALKICGHILRLKTFSLENF